MDRFLGRESPAVTASAKKTAKPASSGMELPANAATHTIECAALTARLASYGTADNRAAWPIERVLGFGAPPTDRSSCGEWIRERHVRVVVDMSHELRDAKSYARHVEQAGAALIHLPVSSKTEMTDGQLVGVAPTLRAMRNAVGNAREAAASESPFAVYFCDSGGGASAALGVVLIVALEYRCSLADAAAFVTLCWSEHAEGGRSALGTSIRMMPQGDKLKKALFKLHGKLRQQPFVQKQGAAAETQRRMEQVFTTHGLPATGRAALHLTSVETGRMLTRMPFSPTGPITVVTWLRQLDPPPEPEPMPQFGRRSDRDFDDDDDDAADFGGKVARDDDDDEARPRWRRRRRVDSDDDDDFDSDY